MTPEDAIQRLYETPNLFDQLRDDEAMMLLRWAENEVTRLAQTAPDDNTFETSFDALSDVAQKINLFVGMRADMPFAEQQNALQQITTQAARIGLSPVPLAAGAQAETDESDAAVLNSLLDMLQPTSTAAASETSTTPDSAGDDSATQPKTYDPFDDEPIDL
ncbi:MAG: hypothetical protein IT320_13895 [Anaerolineae bacterium]|nr:hypothetical protein [Anaerolineae bacterium]